MPMFSIWTVGSIRPTSCCKSQSKPQIPLSRIKRKIQVSIVNTWINTAISTIFAILYIVLCCTSTSNTYFNASIFGAIWLFGTILTLIIITSIDKCQKCCCDCCLTYCLPITRPTILDANNMDKIIYIDELVKDNFLGEMNLESLCKTPEEENISTDESNPKNVIDENPKDGKL